MSIIQKPLLGQDLYIKPEWAKGLVGLWLFNEGSGNKVFDLSGNGNTGILQANASWDAGFIVCETSDDKIISPTTGFGQAGTIIFSFNGTGTPAGYGCFITADVQDNFCILRSNSDTIIYVEINDIVFYLNGADLWDTGKHIVAITWNAFTNTCKRYDDGVLASIDTEIFTAPTYGSNFHWGDRAANERTIGGRFGWIYGYNRALSASEIGLVSREPFCMFEDEPIELWSAATQGGAPAGIPILRRRRECA